MFKKPWRIELQRMIKRKSNIWLLGKNKFLLYRHASPYPRNAGLVTISLSRNFVSVQSKAWNELPTDHTTLLCCTCVCVYIFIHKFFFYSFVSLSPTHWILQTWPSELPAYMWHDSRQQVLFSSAFVRKKRKAKKK